MSESKRQKLDLDLTRIKIIELLLRHDPRDLSFSKISRFLKIPRSTLYYYFGNKFEKVLEDSVSFGVRQFMQTEHMGDFKRYSTWEDFQKDRFNSSLEMMENYPWASMLYIRFRADPGYLGDCVRDYEKKYLKEFRKICQYFWGVEPPNNAERLVAALKVGLMWGIGASLPPYEKNNPININDVKLICHQELLPLFKTILKK